MYNLNQVRYFRRCRWFLVEILVISGNPSTILVPTAIASQNMQRFERWLICLHRSDFTGGITVYRRNCGGLMKGRNSQRNL